MAERELDQEHKDGGAAPLPVDEAAAKTVEPSSSSSSSSDRNADGQSNVVADRRRDSDAQVDSSLPSGATTPAALPELTLPDKVTEAIKTRRRSTLVKAGTTASDEAVIIGIAVVDFNHLLGPTIEYAHPEQLANDEELRTNLPFLALPDGSHLSDEDFCYFHVLSSALHNGTIFGISCNRQIASDKLIVRGKDVTRSTVQKAVVVLARDPVFGPIREKLGVVTRAFFAQANFGETEILVDFHATLEAGLRSARAPSIAMQPTTIEEVNNVQMERRERDAVMYMGTSLRELIYKWRFKTLMLVKLLLLQRKVMFFGYPVERLCTYQYSLISLIPDLLFHLQDAASPALDKQTSKRKRAESLKTSDRDSLMQFMGFPLHLFGQGAFFQPYLPLQQLEVAAKSTSYLVGTTNAVFRMQKECKIDVIVDLEHSNLEFIDPTLQSIVQLTPADRKWMDEIVHTVLDTYNPDDPTRPTSMQYTGSDDHLRTKFEEYICSLLSSIKYGDYVGGRGEHPEAIVAPDPSSLSAFGPEFVHAFKQTQCFELWDRTTDAMVFDLFEHKHPCDGKTSTLEDVSLRLTSGLYDLHLDEHLAKNLAPTRDAVANALNEGSKTAWKYANKWGQDFARFRREQMAQRTAARPDAPGGVDASDKEAELHAPEKGIHHVSTSTAAEAPSTGLLTPSQQQAAQDFQRQAQQAAAQAGTQMRAAWGNFGSFLSAKQKAWAAGAGTAANGTTKTEAAPEASSESVQPASSSTPSS